MSLVGDHTEPLYENGAQTLRQLADVTHHTVVLEWEILHIGIQFYTTVRLLVRGLHLHDGLIFAALLI